MLTDKHKGTKLASVLIDRDQIRGGSRAAVTSKMERFVIIVNGCQPLTVITKHSILDVAAALDPPLQIVKMWVLSFIEKSKITAAVKQTLITDN